MIPDLSDKLSNIYLQVTIKNVVEGSVASKLTGYFILNDEKYNFSAIAFGRIGGHNISIKVSNTSLLKMKKVHLDPEIVLLLVQRKIIEGDFKIEEKKDKFEKLS